METFTIYTKNNCIYCDKIKKFFIDNDIKYVEKKYKKDFSKADFFEQFLVTTFPRVVDSSGKCIGGYEDFVKYYKTYLVW